MNAARRFTTAAAFLALLCASLAAAPTMPPMTAMTRRLDFEGAAEDWELQSDAESTENVEGGCYILTNLSSSRDILRGWRFDLDRGRDWALEADFTILGGKDGAFGGLVWDYKDDANFYSFCIFPDASWSIVRMRGGSSSRLAGPEKSPAARKSGAYNRLRVARTGSTLSFLINGTTVKTLPHETISGQYVGFGAGPRIILRSDKLALILGRDYEGDRLGRSDPDRTVYETSFAKGTEPWALGSGPVYGKFEGPYLDSGGLALEHRDAATYDPLTRAFAFDLGKDFSVEARLRKLSTDDDYGFGLAVDRKGDEYLYFKIAGSGFYSIGRKTSGRTEAWVDWTPHPNVNKFESANLLGIYRRGDKLHFCLNGRKIYEQTYKPWTSTEAGFVLGGALTLRVESLGVYGPPP